MTEETQGAGPLPPPAEEIHLPDPSFLPVLVALGTTIAVVGVVFSWIIVGIGVLIALVALIRWIRLTREEMAELPLEH